MKYGIKIETFYAGGRYQHKVYDIGVNAKNIRDRELSDKVVEALRKINEEVWGEMPKGATGLVGIITYKLPRKK